MIFFVQHLEKIYFYFFLFYIYKILYQKTFQLTSLFNKHILRDIPSGTKLYLENQDINLIIEEFKFGMHLFFLKFFLI